ncbi:MAG TPA: GNAT family N-acetyltransferase [Nocardioidaceae bacterium]|nr:GNAT family N-acetyltransferase [Nocardioidaceae bacterium]
MFDADVPIPEELVHERFVATPLTTDVAALDYASYMASPEVIRVHSDGRWPVDGFTLAEDLELVAAHQSDHESRRAFAFVLLDPTRTEALGCLYVNPLREYLLRAGADPEFLETVPAASAMVTFWLRQDQQGTDLADDLLNAVNHWLVETWPLAMHLFRVLPAERSSCRALDRLGLRQTSVPLHGEARPYVWYRPETEPDCR